MEDYCKSDVALLQADCKAFTQEFEQHADFNPFAKCVTIASACNLYWRKHCLKEDTFAVEPLKGWRGANVNNNPSKLCSGCILKNKALSSRMPVQTELSM